MGYMAATCARIPEPEIDSLVTHGPVLTGWLPLTRYFLKLDMCWTYSSIWSRVHHFNWCKTMINRIERSNCKITQRILFHDDDDICKEKGCSFYWVNRNCKIILNIVTKRIVFKLNKSKRVMIFFTSTKKGLLVSWQPCD